MLTRASLLLAYPRKEWISASKKEEIEVNLCEETNKNFNIIPPVLYYSVDDIADKLAEYTRDVLLDFVVVVDITCGYFFTTGEAGIKESQDSVYGARKLVAEFPEVYFIFIVPDIKDFYENEIPALIRDYHFVLKNELLKTGDSDNAHLYKNYLEQVKNGFRTLFDPTGFRDWIRWNEDAVSHGLHGVSIEDELDYCVFNAYILYKKGYNTFISSTFNESKRLFDGNMIFSGQIEDLLLNFSDLENKIKNRVNPCHIENNSKLEPAKKILIRRNLLVKQRDKRLGSDKKVARLILTLDVNAIEYNEKFSYRFARPKIILKPHKGFYDTDFNIFKNIEKPQNKPNDGAESNHGTRGARANISHTLLCALRKLMTKDSDSLGVIGAIHLAVLANEAYLWLDDNTPSIGVNALILKHKAEAIAECNFSGVGAEIAVDERIKEIDKEIKSCYKNNGKEIEKIQQKNALINILEGTQQIFLQYGKFDEAKNITAKSYSERIELEYLNAKNPYKWIEKEFLLYLGKRISSGREIIKSSIWWVLIFAGFYTLLSENDIYKICDSSGCFLESIYNDVLLNLYSSAYLFITFGFPDDITFNNHPKHGILVKLAHILNSSMGVLHMGMYISYLYSLLSRR